jgi:hypothetical protein
VAWISWLLGTKRTLSIEDGFVSTWVRSWLYVIFCVLLELPGRSVREARKTRRTMTISGKSALRKKRFKKVPLVG